MVRAATAVPFYPPSTRHEPTAGLDAVGRSHGSQARRRRRRTTFAWTPAAPGVNVPVTYDRKAPRFRQLPLTYK